MNNGWKQSATLVYQKTRVCGDMDELVELAVCHIRYGNWQRLNGVEAALACVAVGAFIAMGGEVETNGVKNEQTK